MARLGRFNAVAETLGTTHTTISRRILALDKQLGGRTLERSPHGWELTAARRLGRGSAEAIEETLGSLSGLISQDQQRPLRPGADQHVRTASGPSSSRPRWSACSSSTRC